MDFSFDRFPVDLVLLGLVALFLILRLRSVLGKKVGAEKSFRVLVGPAASVLQRPEPQKEEVKPEVVSLPKTQYVCPPEGSATAQAVQAMQQTERDFVPEQFLIWAETAFRKIVTAFAQGNREVLQTMLTEEAFAAFQSVIAEREKAGHSHKADIRHVYNVTLVDAGLSPAPSGEVAYVDVRFVSDQVSVTLNADKAPVGGIDAVVEFIDLWRFVRPANTQGQQPWRLGAARSG